MATSDASPPVAMASQATKTVLGMVIAISHARRSVGTSKLASYCSLSKCPLRPFAREGGGDSLIPSSRILHQPSHERNLGSRVAFDPARKLEFEQQQLHGRCGLSRLAHQFVHRHRRRAERSEEHPSELQSLMRISSAVF